MSIPVIYNGHFNMPQGRNEINIMSSEGNEVLGQAWKAQDSDGDLILSAAREGYSEWSAMPLHERTDIILRYACLLEKHHEELTVLQCREMGKIIGECSLELSDSTAATKGYVERARHLYGKTLCDNHPGLEKDLIFTRREPIGVFFCIIPFNYPVELYTHKVIPALAMGNSVIVKLPSDNPLVLTRMTQLLVEAGVPPKTVSLVYCDRLFSSQNIIKTNRIDGVSLTGSTKTGISVLKDSAEHLHKVFLELGGNDPLIIFADADLDAVVEEIFVGRIFNTGQTCCGSKRFIVEEKVHDKLLEKLVERLKLLRLGDPMDTATEMGRIINAEAANNIQNQIKHTISQGAKLAYGGRMLDEKTMEPAVLVNITHDMDISNTMEVFGPVIPLIPFNTVEEAISIANQIPYGLQAGIMTADIILATNIASKLQCGSVVINGSGNYRHMDMPFGGFKMTGIGREGVSATLEEYSQEKSYIIKQVF